MLLMQYRMRPQISAFPASHFYQNRLRDAPSVLNRTPLRMHQWATLFGPFLFFDIPSKEDRNPATQSLSNQGEAFFVFSLLRLLTRHFLCSRPPSTETNTESPQDQDAMCLADVAILTPYRQQVTELRRLFESHPHEFPPDQPEVCTIDAFQGREKRVIIFSCVRSSGDVGRRVANGDQSSVSSSDEDDAKNKENNNNVFETPVGDTSALGFVADVRRLNVAVTRARDCLWVVGNRRTLQCDPVWRALINYARGKRKRPNEKRSYVEITAETTKLQGLLRPPHQRRPLGYSNPSIMVGTFLGLSEEFYLLQDQLETRSEPAAGSATTAILHQLDTKVESRRDRSFSNCSSITSSSSASTGETEQPLEMKKSTAFQRNSKNIEIIDSRPAKKSVVIRPPSLVDPNSRLLLEQRKRQREGSELNATKRICRSIQEAPPPSAKPKSKPVHLCLPPPIKTEIRSINRPSQGRPIVTRPLNARRCIIRTDSPRVIMAPPIEPGRPPPRRLPPGFVKPATPHPPPYRS